jgi:dinuclear metal center YbgI/SA1388 family protein
MDSSSLLHYLNALLKPELFLDYCPNGLQVSGIDSISTIVTGVSACQALIDEAIRLKADALLVHHGFFWKGEDPCVVGMKRCRLSALLENNINLIAYHLPLDAHPELGNNFQLAQQLNIHIDKKSLKNPMNLCWHGEFKKPLSPEALSRLITEKLNRAPLHIPGAAKEINNIAWCTGAAQDEIETALSLGVDAFITGEVSERTVHFARENGLHFYAAGHHATERYGIKALGEHLAKKFKIKATFVDIDNPV